MRSIATMYSGTYRSDEGWDALLIAIGIHEWASHFT
jgi:hypothetical protein